MSGSNNVGPFNAVIYPELHAVLGAGILAWFYIYAPLSWFWGFFLFLEVLVINKETWFDPLTEGKTNGVPNQPFFWEGARDLLWWNVGFAAFLIASVLTHRPL